MINIFKKKAVNLAEEYKQKAQWFRVKPSTLAVALNKLLKDNKIFGGVILDAGAGFGLASCYFAKKGYQVKSVEINPGAIPFILENVDKYKVDGFVEVINEPIQEATESIWASSLIAILDVGMSHSLNEADKKIYASETTRILKQGGFLALSHFSEHEEENPSMGRDKEYLRGLFPENIFEIVRSWKEDCWVNPKTGAKHAAWTVIFRKKLPL